MDYSELFVGVPRHPDEVFGPGTYTSEMAKAKASQPLPESVHQLQLSQAQINLFNNWIAARQSIGAGGTTANQLQQALNNPPPPPPATSVQGNHSVQHHPGSNQLSSSSVAMGAQLPGHLQAPAQPDSTYQVVRYFQQQAYNLLMAASNIQPDFATVALKAQQLFLQSLVPKVDAPPPAPQLQQLNLPVPPKRGRAPRQTVRNPRQTAPPSNPQQSATSSNQLALQPNTQVLEQQQFCASAQAHAQKQYFQHVFAIQSFANALNQQSQNSFHQPRHATPAPVPRPTIATNVSLAPPAAPCQNNFTMADLNACLARNCPPQPGPSYSAPRPCQTPLPVPLPPPIQLPPSLVEAVSSCLPPQELAVISEALFPEVVIPEAAIPEAVIPEVISSAPNPVVACPTEVLPVVAPTQPIPAIQPAKVQQPAQTVAVPGPESRSVSLTSHQSVSTFEFDGYSHEADRYVEDISDKLRDGKPSTDSTACQPASTTSPSSGKTDAATTELTSSKTSSSRRKTKTPQYNKPHVVSYTTAAAVPESVQMQAAVPEPALAKLELPEWVLPEPAPVQEIRAATPIQVQPISVPEPCLNPQPLVQPQAAAASTLIKLETPQDADEKKEQASKAQSEVVQQGTGAFGVAKALSLSVEGAALAAQPGSQSEMVDGAILVDRTTSCATTGTDSAEFAKNGRNTAVPRTKTPTRRRKPTVAHEKAPRVSSSKRRQRQPSRKNIVLQQVPWSHPPTDRKWLAFAKGEKDSPNHPETPKTTSNESIVNSGRFKNHETASISMPPAPRSQVPAPSHSKKRDIQAADEPQGCSAVPQGSTPSSSSNSHAPRPVNRVMGSKRKRSTDKERDPKMKNSQSKTSFSKQGPTTGSLVLKFSREVAPVEAPLSVEQPPQELPEPDLPGPSKKRAAKKRPVISIIDDLRKVVEDVPAKVPGQQNSIGLYGRSADKYERCPCGIPLINLSYIECSICKQWYHIFCCVAIIEDVDACFECEWCQGYPRSPLDSMRALCRVKNIELIPNLDHQNMSPFVNPISAAVSAELELNAGDWQKVMQIVTGREWFAPLKYGTEKRLVAATRIDSGALLFGLKQEHFTVHTSAMHLQGDFFEYRGLRNALWISEGRSRINDNLLKTLRMSCKSNAKITHAVVKGQLYFAVIATDHIDEDVEIKLETSRDNAMLWHPCAEDSSGECDATCTLSKPKAALKTRSQRGPK